MGGGLNRSLQHTRRNLTGRMGQVQTCAWLYRQEMVRKYTAMVEVGVFPMFMLRAAGSMLLIYALFNAAFGLNRQELPWLISAFLLAIGGIALVVAQPWSRIVVLAAAVAAVAVGAISQFRTAKEAHISLEDAAVAWALWSALWLTTAYIGSKYLSEQRVVLEGRPGGAP